MNDSATLDRPAPYHVKESERNHLQDRIRALGAQAKAHEDLARAIRGEMAAMKREAGIEIQPCE